MPKCPKCGKEIDSLDVVVSEKNLYSYKRSGDYHHIEQIEFNEDYYKCPLCYRQLDIEDADEFFGKEEQ
jgi:hypothetical protein